MSPKSLSAREKLTVIGEELFGKWGWQTKMAKELGVNISSVKRWIAGTVPIPSPVILALEHLLTKKQHPELNYPSIDEPLTQHKSSRHIKYN